MSQIQEFQSVFESFREYFDNETQSSIDIEVPLQNLQDEEITSTLEFAHKNENFFEDFEVVVQSDTIREVDLIRLRGGLISSEHGFNELEAITEEVEFGDRIIDELVEQEQFGDITEQLLEWEAGADFNFSLDLIVDKGAIQQSVRQTEDPPVSTRVHVWTDIGALKTWLESIQGGYEEIDYLFPDDEYPIFIMIWGDSVNSGRPLQFLTLAELLGSFENYEECYGQYRDLMDQANSLIKSSSDIPVVSPLLFNTSELRDLFPTIFLYSFLASVSDDVRVLGTELSFSIEAGSRSVSDQMSPSGIKEKAQSMSESESKELFEFYTKFSDKGTNETYREFWQRSIIHITDSLLDIPNQRCDIESHYEFLEKEAIEQNFSDLSDAIQDAHTFTAEVTSTVSESTTNLTSEIQKVVLTLLGAIFANIFLVLRWSNIRMVLPFSILVIGGILLFYFPTIQTRINQLETIISENDEDFDVYSEAIEEFSGELFDFSEFRARRDSYIEYANKQKTWAIDSLELTFTILVLTWTLLTAVSVLFFDYASRQFIAAIASIPIVMLIRRLQNDNNYYPQDFEEISQKLKVSNNCFNRYLRRTSPVQLLIYATFSAILVKISYSLFKIALSW